MILIFAHVFVVASIFIYLLLKLPVARNKDTFIVCFFANYKSIVMVREIIARKKNYT